jgi:hypothetical protein
LELALEFAQIREQPGDLAGVVFIHSVQSDQRVQDQQDGPELLDGVGEARAVGGGDVVRPEAVKLIDTCEKALQSFKCNSCNRYLWFSNAENVEWVQCQCGDLRWRYGNG